MKKKILINADARGKNHYHIGDEAMLTSLVDYIKDLDVEIKVLSLDPKFTSKNLGVNASYKLFPIKDIIDCNLFLISGGGNINSKYRVYTFHQMILILIAKLFKKKVAMVSQTIGPLTGFDRFFVSLILNLVDSITIRDCKLSPEELSKMNITKPKILQCPDDAFFLKGKKAKYVLNKNKSIGVCLHDLNNDKIDFFAKQFDTISKKYTVVFIPFDIPSDVKTHKKIISKMKNKKNLVLIENGIDREIKWLVSKVKVMVSSRYHGIIFALSNNVPIIGIFKDKNHFKKLAGIPHFDKNNLISINKNSTGALHKKIKEIMSKYKKKRKELLKLNGIIKSNKNVNRTLIAEIINSK